VSAGTAGRRWHEGRPTPLESWAKRGEGLVLTNWQHRALAARSTHVDLVTKTLTVKSARRSFSKA